MKKTITLLVCLAAGVTAWATPFTVYETGAHMRMDAKSLEHKDLSVLDGMTRDQEWDIPAPIYTLPAGGERKLYSRSSDMCYYTYNGLGVGKDDYFAGEVVTYENGDVYMRNMIPSMTSGSYLKGKLEDGKITLQFPQGLCYDNPFYDDDGNLVTDSVWPVFRAKYEISYYYDEELEAEMGQIDVWIDPDSQTVTFTVNEDGSITIDEDDVMLSVFTQGGIWYSEAAWNYVYTPFDEQEETLPEGLKTEKWSFWTNYLSDMAHLAMDGDDIYWEGTYKSLPKSVVKGKIEGNKVMFESPKYIGIDPRSYHLAYFCGTTSINNRLNILDKATLKYDPEAMTMSAKGEYFIINAGPKTPNLIEQYNSPTLHYQGGDIVYTEPLKPSVEWVDDWIYDPVMDCYSWFTVVSIPNIDKNGNYLDPERMWYNIFFDDEIFWFDTEDYQLVADSTDVPYDYNDGINIFYNGTFEHYVYFYWTGFRKMQVQSVFEDLEGNVYRSEMAEYINRGGGGDSVESLESDETPVSVAYYDLQGRRIAEPRGLCISRSIYADGSVRTKKIIRR